MTSPPRETSLMRSQHFPPGFTLIELVITLVVLTILTLGVLPLLQTAIRRQHEQRLREALREMRLAINDFHRDTAGMQCVGSAGGGIPREGFVPPPDIRSKVIIADCTIFGVDNPDRYPPDLETLVKGVSVVPRATVLIGSGPSGPSATDNTLTSTKKKIYLRKIPIDPMMGEADWELRSTYDAADATSWGGENVFDVRSKSNGTALNGGRYSDW